MPYDFFKNAVEAGLSQLPNESMRDRQQAAIDAGWDVTTNLYTVQQQADIGSDTYNDIDVWIGNGIEMTSRGLTNGDDFKHLTFRSIDYEPKRGLYYKFDNNVWITNFTDNNASLDVTIGVRRCNNVLKVIDPENGSVFCAPCVLAYEMTAPSIQVTNAILTPNNHVKVFVQGNDDTFRLFKLNTRFILEGRAFKLFAYQDAIMDENIAPLPTFLTLDLFLDEIHAKDDIENQIADNGTYDYTISIDSNDMELVNGATGVLNTSVALNGQEVKRKVIWESLSPGIVEIDENGKYIVYGEDGDSCTLIASLDGNEDVYATVNIAVRSAETLRPKVLIEPSFDSIREYETVDFKVMASYGSQIYNVDATVQSDSKYLSIVKEGDHFKITGHEISLGDQKIVVEVQNEDPDFEATYEFPVRVTSMLG